MTSTWSFPTKIIFDPGAIGEVSGEVRSLGVERPLIVTDQGIVNSGLLERLTIPLSDAGVSWAIFDRVEGNPTESSVFPGLDMYKAGHCDGLIAMGGGSAIDATKAIRLKISHSLPLGEYD